MSFFGIFKNIANTATGGLLNKVVGALEKAGGQLLTGIFGEKMGKTLLNIGLQLSKGFSPLTIASQLLGQLFQDRPKERSGVQQRLAQLIADVRANRVEGLPGLKTQNNAQRLLWDIEALTKKTPQPQLFGSNSIQVPPGSLSINQSVRFDPKPSFNQSVVTTPGPVRAPSVYTGDVPPPPNNA